MQRALAVLLAAFALLLQVNAPIQTALMSTADDGAAICVFHQDGRSSPDKSPPSRHEACAACAVCALSGAALAPVAIALLLRSLIIALTSQRLRTTGARAPPIWTVRARGPPAFA